METKDFETLIDKLEKRKIKLMVIDPINVFDEGSRGVIDSITFRYRRNRIAVYGSAMSFDINHSDSKEFLKKLEEGFREVCMEDDAFLRSMIESSETPVREIIDTLEQCFEDVSSILENMSLDL